MGNVIHRGTNYMSCQWLTEQNAGQHFVAMRDAAGWNTIINGLRYYLFTSTLRNEHLVKILEQRHFDELWPLDAR